MVEEGAVVEEVVVVEEGTLGRTKLGKVRRRRPGGGRKKTESGAYKESYSKMLARHPETVDIMLNIATGVAQGITCPKCKNRFDKKIGMGADPEMLKHIDNRVMGKPKQTTEIDITGTLELNSSQLSRLSQKIDIFLAEVAAISVPVIEAEFKVLPHPDVSDVRQKSSEYEVATFKEIPAEVLPPILLQPDKYVDFTTPDEEEE